MSELDHEDRPLTAADVQELGSADALARFFGSLGYPENTRMPMTAAALSLNQSLTDAARHIERLVSVDGALVIYLFELTSVTVVHTQALARAFRDRGADFLFVLTDDYRRIDFVLLDREVRLEAQTTLARPRVLTVDRTTPDRVALRVLRRFTFTEIDEDGDLDPYAQFEKLKSAFTIAEWSEPLFNNRALFSDYYLNERLPELDLWHAPERNQAFRAIRRVFAQTRQRLRDDATAASEALIRPVLEILGFEAKSGAGGTAADLLLRTPSLPEGAGAVALALTYPWHRYLDGKDAKDLVRSEENPGAQVVSLLDQEVAPWAIVTNGKTWRLYSARAHSRATNYYEIDLEEVLALADPGEAFRYFYLLFRAAAFSPGPPGPGESQSAPFLDWLMDESTAYAQKLGERLKVRVFEEIFPHFATGFVEGLGGSEALLALPEAQREAWLQTLFDATLTFLYRLLFLLYAESRDLLPVREVRGYRRISLRRLKERIAEKAGPIEDVVPEKLAAAYDKASHGGVSVALYDDLLKLFRVIAEGRSAYNVPTYNGGLFQMKLETEDTSRDGATARFLLETQMPDHYLALGLDRLTRDIDPKRGDLGFIDYKSLGVRQLGSIYEGLLEFKVRVAPETMAVVQGAKTEEVVTLKEAERSKRKILTQGRGKNAEPRTLQPGTVYLENDRRERKATGSYYTPDYIVNYIVRHTVGPVMDEKLAALRPRLEEAARRYRATEKRKIEVEKVKPEALNRPALLQDIAGDVLRDLFDVKVLDPAMGSGHFLVEAVDYITDRLVQFLDGFPFLATFFEGMRVGILDELQRQKVTVDPAQLTDVTLLKRHVLKRCIYGVDLNPMAVELAKVSLWLDCFTLGAPLSFLDHHLRCGNSLIGAMARDVAEEMAGPQGAGQMTFLTGPFVGLLRAAEIMRGISGITDVTLEQVQESSNLFKAFDMAAKPFKQLLDIYVSQYFGVERAGEFLKLYGADALRADTEKLGKPYRQVIERARDLYEEKRFFHWDLEFPEVFVDLAHATWAENGGFDAVVGNPPYGVADDKQYLSSKFPTTAKSADVFVAFLEQGARMAATDRRLGFIVPLAWQTGVNYSALRKHLLELQIRTVVNLPFNVFPDAYVDTGILILAVRPYTSGSEALTYIFPKSARVTDLTSIDYSRVAQSEWKNSIDAIILDPIKLRLIGRLIDASRTIEFGKLTESTRGILTSGDDDVASTVEGDKWEPFFDGSFNRYESIGPGLYVLFGDNLRERPASMEVFAGPRILIRRLVNRQDRLMSTFAVKPFVVRKDVYIFKLTSNVYDPMYLLALLNSRLLAFAYLESDVAATKDDFRQTTLEGLRSLPIRQVRFASPEAEQLELVRSACNHYDQGRYEASFAEVSTAITKGTPGSSLTSGPRPIDAEEKSDVIHSFLAYLAEQMIEMHKEKQTRVEAFWTDLAASADPGTFDTLRNKGKRESTLWKDAVCRPYVGEGSGSTRTLHESLGWDAHCFVAFAGRLVGASSVTQAMRSVYQRHFEGYRAITTRIAATDQLIDQVVYRLYGLSEEEVAVVEGKTVTELGANLSKSVVPVSTTSEQVPIANTTDAQVLLDVLLELDRGGQSEAELFARVSTRDPSRDLKLWLVTEICREYRGVGWLDRGLALVKKRVPARLLMQNVSPRSFHLELAVAHELQNQVVSQILQRLFALAPERQGAVVLPEPDVSAPADARHLREFVAELVRNYVHAMKQEYKSSTMEARLDSQILIAETLSKVEKAWPTMTPSRRNSRLTTVVREMFAQQLIGDISPPQEFIHGWVPRLAYAGLIMWAKQLYNVEGFTIFPVVALRQEGADFRKISVEAGTVALQAYTIHDPINDEFISRFADALYSEFQALGGGTSREYVSLLTCRDRICYRLRIGNSVFERLLAQCIQLSVSRKLPFSVSVEADRSWLEQTDQSMEIPVYVNGPRYIVSMKKRGLQNE